MARLAISLLVLLGAAPSIAQARSWRAPVDGPLLRAFQLGTDPYAAGQHRGVDLGAPPGSTVRSACGGRTTFAGRVPRGGLTVAVRCGSLIATYQQLGASALRGGQAVVAGARVGEVGHSRDPRTPAAHVHLGAREAATGDYVDPLTLFGAGRPVLPLAPPVRHGPRSMPVRPAPPLPRSVPRGSPVGVVPAARRAPARTPRTAPLGRAPSPALPRRAPLEHPATPLRAPRGAVEPGRAPLVVWLGLASVGIALPVGSVLTLRSRRRARRDAFLATS